MAWVVKFGEDTASLIDGVWSSDDTELLEDIRRIDAASMITGSAVSLDHAIARYVASVLGGEIIEGVPFVDTPSGEIRLY